MTGAERAAMIGLTGTYCLRMLGLYLALPILSPYTASLPGGATFWVGMAVGGYGLTQGLFQLPFGALSDHIGRKPTILVGLGFFAVGSVIAGQAGTAPMLVLGRLLQGVGAIAAVIVATVADLAREEVRQRAMTMLGVGIAVSFSVGVVGGPVLAGRIGVPALFYAGAGLAALAALGVLFLVPEPLVSRGAPRPTVRQTMTVFHDPILMRLNAAMFTLHLGITAIFVALPFQFEEFMTREATWRVYGPAILAGMVAMFLVAECIDRFRVDKPVLVTGAFVLTAGYIGLYAGFDTSAGLFRGLLLFVVGFALVEPIFPALLTRYTSTSTRGTAAGAFSMCQFFGAAVGGIVGAFFLARNARDLFWFLALSGLIIAGLSLWLPDPRRFRVLSIPLAADPAFEWKTVHDQLLTLKGVKDATYTPGDGIRVKYVEGKVTEGLLRRVVGTEDSSEA